MFLFLSLYVYTHRDVSKVNQLNEMFTRDASIIDSALCSDPPCLNSAVQDFDQDLCSEKWLALYEKLTADMKSKLFIRTSGQIICASKGEMLVKSSKIPSISKSVSCAPGTYQDEDYVVPLSCKTCLPGFAAMTNVILPCSACVGGQYQDLGPDERTSFGCKICDKGKSSVAGATICSCPEKFYIDPKDNNECLACTAGMNCSFPGTRLEDVVTVPGKLLLFGCCWWCCCLVRVFIAVVLPLGTIDTTTTTYILF